MNKTTICKIAVEVQERDSSEDEESDEESILYRHNGRNWKYLNFIERSPHISMHDIKWLTLGGGDWSRKFKVEMIEDANKLWLGLAVINGVSNQQWYGPFQMPQKLFHSLFYHVEEHKLNLCYGHNKATKKYVTTKLFDELQQKHGGLPQKRNDIKLPASFRPVLCQYQKNAVTWLCQRERQTITIPHFYTKLTARDNETVVYAHKYCLDVQSSQPNDIVIPFGGILADEMGLGKTVEILALILLHSRTVFDDLPQALSSLEESPSAAKRSRCSELFCLCGFNKVKTSQTGSIQCVKCEQWQHEKCVCGFDGAHDERVNQPYVCPQCWSDIASKQCQLVPSRATLIITPNTIKLQWLAEIRKHVYPALRVFVYDGISKSHWISPRQLANYDIVLTDYNVLRKEVYHTTEYVPERVTRKKPRQMRCNTPLLMVEWWRVCLDEAQMVESNLSKLAHLTFQIPAVNRWAVTGTPIQNTIDDLRSLVEFVGFNEICYPRSVWDNLVRDFLNSIDEHNDEYSANTGSKLIEFLQLCMWRTCKSKVDHELKIPPQTEEVHYVTLSNLEKLFYTEQHAACEKNFNKNFDAYIEREAKRYKSQSTPALIATAEISPHIMKIFLEPLLKIRQCCTIPVVSGGGGCFSGGGGNKLNSHNINNAVGQKKFLQPKDLHTHLKSTNEIECKSQLRSMASSYNGIAAIYFIRKNYAEAIRFYEQVLKLTRDYDGLNISVDSLLQIHALHNILQAYNSAPNPSKLLSLETAAQYEEQCNKLEWKYLEPYASQMKRVQDAYVTAIAAFDSAQSQAETDLMTFVGTLAKIISQSKAELFHIPLMEKIYDECVLVFPNSALLTSITSIHSALYVLKTWHGEVLRVQKKLRAEFDKLKFFTANVRSRSQVSAGDWREMMQFVSKIYDCHLSEIRTKPKENEAADKSADTRCHLCNMNDTLNEYEGLLFNKVLDKETNLMEGLANPSPQITLLKVIFSFTKSKACFQQFSAEFDKHGECIKCMQSLWKKMLTYWIEIEYTVKAYDELDMCKMRISLTENEDEKSNFKLLEFEVDDMLVEQQTLFHAAQAEFAAKFARLKYILHLESNADPGACPICHSEEEARYAVLECGHHICLSCLKSVRELNKTAKFSCSICRNQQNSKKIYYVTRTAERNAVDNEIKGNFSSKISYIVNQVLKLQEKDGADEPGAKILIFSQWEPILNAIADALRENEIRYRNKWSPQSIEEFKNPHLGITCMLMPLSKGSKGLNLIEATHVFLVEPILNPAEELQAIGRVHRFGQTRSTTVHRFIVVNTIEENIYFTVNKGGDASKSKWSFENMNLESLRGLFHLENDVYHSC